MMPKLLALALITSSIISGAGAASAQNASSAATHATTTYRSTQVDGLRIFYREAGPRDAPVVLLLHGFPSSSRMFDTLIPLLADRYRVIAPDYPGFGHSEAPDPASFEYSFANITRVVDIFTEQLGLDRYAIYLADYGGPVGYRLATAHPERVTALIVQNAVAHEEGLDPELWAARRAFWADRAPNEARLRQNLLSPEAARLRHVGRSPRPERYNPDLWQDEIAFLSRPGQDRIQADLFYDYRTNLSLYPAWQAYLRKYRPPVLVLWGRYDPSFSAAEVDALKRTLPSVEAHLLDAGHFALDEATDEIAAHMRRFLDIAANSNSRSARNQPPGQ